MKTEKEKMLAGETYFAYDPELMELHRQALRLVKEYNAICFDDYKRDPGLLQRLLPHAEPTL